MATIKSYTDINQSKKLAKILPFESADMWYINGSVGKIRIGEWKNDVHDEDDIPCWSLAALLCVLPTLDGRNAVLCKDIRYDKWHIDYHSTTTLPMIDTERYDSPIDACVEMILKLHEYNLL